MPEIFHSKANNIYPTDEDLFISHSENLPIISSKPFDLENTHSTSTGADIEEQHVPSTFISQTPLQQNWHYKDGQIIPWRKLYAKQRIEESALQSSLTSSRFIKFLVKYNQWPTIIVSSIILAILTVVLDWSTTWINDIKYGYCKSSIFSVRESCNAEEWYLYQFSSTNNIALSFLNLLFVTTISIILAIVGLSISKTSFWIAKSGISELKMIIAGHVNNEFLKPFLIIKKFVSLIFIISCGGLLLGYEGPLIHISCGVISFIIDRFSSSSLFFQNLNNEAIKREIISIGFVIGISLAFGAPIGGLLFSIENLKWGTRINALAWTGFVCSSIATFIFFKIHPFKIITMNGSFAVDIANGWILFETFPYILVGLLCGFVSLLFIKVHLKLIDLRNKFKNLEGLPSAMYNLINNSYFEISILVLITHILTYPLNFSYLTLNNILLNLFYDCGDNTTNTSSTVLCQSSYKLEELSYFFVLIFFLSNYAYTLDIPGGMLLPSLTIGGTLGRIVGEIVQTIQFKSGSSIFLECYEKNQKCVSPGSYAIVGAASFFAGFTNTSVAAVVIVFELTGAVTYLIPLMLGVVVSKTIIDIFGSKGFEELWLMKVSKTYINSELTETMSLAHLSEIPILDVIDAYDPHVLYVDDELLTCSQLISKIENIFEENREKPTDISNDGFVLLKSKFNPIIVGWINFNDLHDALISSNSADNTLVSFSTLSTESEVENIVKLDSYIVPKHELIIVNSEYSLLSAYELINRLLITNIFVCDTKKDGTGFRGILRISDLAKLLKK